MKKRTTKAAGAKPEGEKQKLHRLKDVLEAKNVEKSGYWLAQKSGITYNSINSYLNNKMEPSLSQLKKIVDTLKENGITISGKDLINF